MKKNFAAAFIAVMCFALAAFTVFAADSVSYTFSGINCITDGSTDEIADKPLTDSITVTTSGAMNRKYAAITDLAHNNEVGTFPANEDFKAAGSYIYLGAASSNDGAVITLNLPKIQKGSRVTLTFAKPTVTNNGSTLRNTGDPYAYFKIGDRYLSINGDNFDKWRTESVVIGEDTDTIEFHCDKWGAVAIEKIEISDGMDEKLSNLNIKSTQYANITVNGIKFCADENGNLTVPSLPDGSEAVISAQKDGYKTAEKTITISGDTDVEIMLECETDAVYYESDFGNTAGELALDGEYKFGDGIEAKDVTRISARIIFAEDGELLLNTDKGTLTHIVYKDGIYVNDEYITSKDNMEFTLTLDKELGVICTENNKNFKVKDTAVFDTITSISGKSTAIEYVGISYPDTAKITIDGPDKISSIADDRTQSYYYLITPEYNSPNSTMSVSVSGVDGVCFVGHAYDANGYNDKHTLLVKGNVSGKATICAEYNGVKTYKEIEIVKNPKISGWKHDGNTLNLYSSKTFSVYGVEDEYGNDIYSSQLQDFKSSDESVIKIDQNGVMTAVGKGKATISANAYTGADNPISVEYTVDQFYIGGITENDISYASGELAENDNITSYKISYSDGTSEAIEEMEIPAFEIKSDGSVITVSYDLDGDIDSVIRKDLKAGDKTPVSNGSKHVYLYTDGKLSEITEADTTMDGYKIEHKAGERYEISPVYTFTDIGDVKDDGKTLDGVFYTGLYNITFKKAETWRGDIYVNGFMVGNNVDQADADRKITDGALYTAEDIKVKDGKITVSMCDGSTMLDYVTVEKQPEFYERPQRVYVIGDSLACNYYGEFENEVGGGRSGWGQQLPDFLNVPVTNLANSGQYAKGLYETAFPSVMENGEPNDILLIECAYNDRSYSTRDEMISCVKDMISQSLYEHGIIPILVTPNASEHDYKPSVVWSSYLRDIAVDTDCQIIDLSKESYDFLYSLYGDNADGVIKKNYNLTEVGGDNLHSSYAAAYKWASIVAQGLKDIYRFSGIVNTDFSYTFTDTLGNVITAEVK